MRFTLLLIALLGLVSGSVLAAGTFRGRVVSVADGDTLTVLVGGRKQVKVRLAEIDTPERRQPWGKRAKQALSALVFGKQVKVEALKKDRYKRTVGRVYMGGKNVGREMVRTGNAWVYRKYNRDSSLLALEAEARRRRRGLWALPASQRIPPWEWRHKPKKMPRKATASKTGAGYSCGTKRYCGQMANCAEARYYLTHCGAAGLDGNHDGVPCNKLCR